MFKKIGLSLGKINYRMLFSLIVLGLCPTIYTTVRVFFLGQLLLMVVRMVNVVNEQGTYWVANNFIWGWLLLPVTQLAELIKRDCATDKRAVQDKTLGYMAITAIICVLWAVTIPAWKPFMANVLGFSDVNKLFNLIMVLLGFYVLYAFQSIFDATFYGLGKTNLMFFESIVTNSMYYGVAFILYVTGVWTPTLTGIALLFGIGVAFDSVVSLCAYIYLLKKCKINIFVNFNHGVCRPKANTQDNFN